MPANPLNTLTLPQIKAMFKPGQKWHGVTTWPGTDRVWDNERTILQVRSADIIYSVLGHKRRVFMTLPKAREVIEAYDGHLKFTYDNPGNGTVILDRLPVTAPAAEGEPEAQ